MNISPRTQRILQITAGTTACLLALVVGLVIARSGRVAYPDCPFTKLPAGSVCVIATQDPPPKNKKEEWTAYWDARRAIFAEMKKTGCEKDVTPEEAEALKSYADNKYVRAREQSEALLRKNANSLAGMYVRTGALLEGEANPAAALRQIRVMRRALEATGRKDPNNKAAREWYIRCVNLEHQALERLGEDRYAIRCVELLEQVFEPLPWKKTWSLFRLKEFKQAEETIAATEQTGRFPVRALNSRLALELQFNRRADGFHTAENLIAALSPEDEQDVYLSNRALASWAAFKFDEVEANLKLNIQHEDKYSRGTAYVGLADLYLQQGRLADARDALIQAKTQRDRRDPSTWQFDDGERRTALAKLLLVAGRADAAERLARACVERPDRLGTSTMGAKDQGFLADVLLYAALHDRIEAIRESESLGTFEPEQGNRRALEMELWLISRRIHSELNDRRAEIAFQPHADEMPTTWLAPTVLEVLPAGVAQAMLTRAQALDADTGAAPYYLAYQAELDWRNGRHQRALETVETALQQLPVDDEALLRTRLAAIAGDAAFRLGRLDESRTHFSQVLSTQPGLLRSLSIKLPVSVETDGSETAEQVATLLVCSPRFVEHKQGVSIRITATNGQAKCILTQGSSEPVEVSVTNEADAAAAKRHTLQQRTSQAFLTAVFSSRLEIDDTTINRISGTTGAVRERDAISKVMESLNKKKS